MPSASSVQPPSVITAATRVFAVLGDPVAHSLSPIIQNAAIQGTGVDGVYVALRCGDGELQGVMTGLAQAGGGGNVTLPHKERAAALVEVPSDAVRRTGACNTFWVEDGRLRGDNTDVDGLRRALREDPDVDVGGRRVLLLGAGGAGRAALMALLEEGAEEVVLLNRSVERARIVARRIGGARTRVAMRWDDVKGQDFHLVVHATRLGLEASDPLPVQLEELGALDALVDVVYGRDPTRLVLHARELGLPARDGREMLLQQGAVAFERWWGREAPLQLMREALTAGGRPG